MRLTQLGFSRWFQTRVDASKGDDLKIARVIAVHKDSYVIQNEMDPVYAEITGRLMFSADSPLDYPTVGDWVYAQYLDDDALAIIHLIFPRKSVLKRKTPGKRTEYQLIAANIDTAFIIQSLDANFNIRRLERYLAMINESHIHPVVLLSKSDLIPPTATDVKINEIRAIWPKLQCVAFSNKNQAGSNRVKELFSSGRTYCLLGSSGVGKTTLLNNLMGASQLKTREVRAKDGKGRHATTHRQLIMLNNNAMVVDTPGMRELGHIGIENGIEETFEEIATLSHSCRYNDCGHTHENGCAVLSALADGIISEKRYRNYIKMSRESAYYQQSYLEKRRKDKQFGKMVKSVMKHHEK